MKNAVPNSTQEHEDLTPHRNYIGLLHRLFYDVITFLSQLKFFMWIVLVSEVFKPPTR